jgi:hypothetical protein
MCCVGSSRLPSCGMMFGMFRRCVIGLLVAVLVAGCTSDDTRPPTLPPGVISPAPKPVKNGVRSECFVGMIRADRGIPAEVIAVIGSHVPTWLPKGFGFFIGWRGTKYDLTPSTRCDLDRRHVQTSTSGGLPRCRKRRVADA